MAIDPVFSYPAAPEPPPRSRASDAPNDSQTFVLPDDRDQSAPPPKDSSRPAADAKQPADGKTADAQGASKGGADNSAKADASAKAPGGPPAPAAAPDANQVPPAKQAAAAADVGALASILAAAEAAAAAEAHPKDGAPVETVAEDGTAVQIKPGKKKAAEGEDASDAAASETPVAAQASTPASTAADLLVLLGLGVPATEVKNQPQPAEAKGDGAKPAAPHSGPAITASPAAFLGNSGITGPAAAGPVETAKEPEAAAGVGSGAGSGSKAQLTADALAASKADTASNAAPVVAPASEIKLPDTLQQALSPIDLTALVAQASGKAAHPQAAVTAQDPSAAAGSLPQAQTPMSVPTPLHVLPIEIGMRALSGAKSFDIRLDPAELGRVDVNLSISDKGEVSAKLVVDRVETLHLLQRDARTLERAFEQAGLKPSDSGVDISLRDNSGQAFRQQRQQDETPQRPRRGAAGEDSDEVSGVSAVAAQPQRQIMRLGGVDLSI